MPALIFRIGEMRYALPGADITEIVPRVNLQRLPDTPAWIAGGFRYRGQVIPVADLHQLRESRPCPLRLSSRIIVVRFPHRNSIRPLGLLAEHVTELQPMPDISRSYESGPGSDGVRFGPLIADERGILCVIRLETMLPTSWADRIFSVPPEPEL